MTEEVSTVHEDAPLDEVIALMTELEVRHVPVVADDGRLVGVLSDRDMRMVDGLIAQDIDGDGSVQPGGAGVLATPASSLLSGEPITCRVDTPIDEVIDLLLAKRIGAVVVVDAGDRVAGIVSSMDVLAAARGKLG